MDADCANINDIVVEQNVNLNNEVIQSSSETQIYVEEKKKKASIDPISLNYSWLSTHSTTMTVSTFCLSTVIAMTVGILVVCITSSNKQMKKCEVNFTRTNSNPIEYQYGPRSVAMGDFNNDTCLDIVVANAVINNIAIYFGFCDGTFDIPIFYETGLNSVPYMVAVGDFNKDSQLDIAVANIGSNNIGIFLGLGNKSFNDQIQISTNITRPISIYVADFNNDTISDIATANFGNESVSLFYGYGNGNFSDPLTYSTGYDSFPLSMTAEDFNNDGYLDLAIANSGTNNIGILFGINNGTFKDQVIISTGYGSHPYSLAVGDFNNDSFVDFAVANYGMREIGVFLNHGNGTFATPTNYSISPASPYSIDVGDFNQDNRLDLIVTSQGTNNIGVLLGRENGTFIVSKMYSTGSFSSISFSIGDLNKDKRLDIVVVSNDTGAIDILIGAFEGFPNQTTSFNGDHPESLAVHDFNNDTQLDIVVVNSVGGSANILLGYANNSFINQPTEWIGFSLKSIGVGDFNNDTLSDIVVVDFQGSQVSILLGYGNGSFRHQTTYETNYHPYSVAVGDFNNDTLPDIVVTNSGGNDISVFLGYGNGSFTDQITYDVGYFAVSVAVDDFNKDNLPDIVVVNSRSNDISILLGCGNGSFTNQITYSAVFSPMFVAVSDFNNDALSDIAVANYRSSDVSVFLGYGNGSFANQTRYSTGFYPISLAVGDFNNDERIDIAITNYGHDDVSVLLGYGNGSFANQITFATGKQPHSVAIGDFNKDNRLDLVVANYGSNDVSLLIQYNRGVLVNERTYAPGGGSSLRSVAVGDVNNDTQLDIIVANYGSNSIGVLFGYGNGSFANQMMLDTGSNSHPSSIAINELNGDYITDIAVVNYISKNLRIMLGTENGTFTEHIEYRLNFDFAPIVVSLGDFNNDKRSEIIVIYDSNDNVDIFAARNVSSFENQILSIVYDAPQSVAVGDFNNDTLLDLVVTNPNIYAVTIIFGYGNGSFASPIMYAAGADSWPSCVAVSDFNNDTLLDIVITNSGSESVRVFLGISGGNFAPLNICPTGNMPVSVIVGDFNNDARMDIVVTNYGSKNVSVLLGNGDGTFANQTTYETGDSPYSVAMGDFNNDTLLDIVVANMNSDNVSVLLGYGNGSFANQIMYKTGRSPISLAVGDFNNDSRLDIVVVNSRDNNVSVLLGYGDGSFTNQTTYETGPSPIFVAVSDFNNDNLSDIVVANSNDVHVSVLLGYGNGSFTNQIMYLVGISPSSVAVADFNNDKRLDIAVANFDSTDISILLGNVQEVFIKKTTLTLGNESQPKSLVTTDFNHDDLMDIGFANSDKGTISIFLGYGNISFASEITYSTGQHSSPHSIAVDDLNNDTQIDIVVANYGSNNVSIFFGNSSGTFTDQVTYSTGPYSSPSYIAIADFNNDMILDIVVANYDTNNIGVLIGYGNGTFANIILFPLKYGSHPFFIGAGDFNNDRKLDLVVANNGTDSLYMLLQTC